jgi:mono/diheme cytochrome c family protein
MNNHWVMAVAVACAVVGLPVTGADKLPPALEKSGVTYDKDIKSLFESSCFKCHGPEKQKGKVRLDSLAAALKSGGGKAVIPGKSAESQIVISVARVAVKDEENMPPAGKGEPLTKEQVGLIRAWIDQGAK